LGATSVISAAGSSFLSSRTPVMAANPAPATVILEDALMAFPAIYSLFQIYYFARLKAAFRIPFNRLS
jgi:hypothetical protein